MYIHTYVYMLELYHGGAWFMVYTSGAVSIEHEGVARVFYSKQKPRVCTINHKPRVCTINHKPRHGTTVLYNAIARRALFGHGLCTWLSDCGAALPHKRERSRALQLGKKLSQLPLRVTQLSRCYIPVLKPSRMLSSSLIKLSYHPACC